MHVLFLLFTTPEKLILNTVESLYDTRLMLAKRGLKLKLTEVQCIVYRVDQTKFKLNSTETLSERVEFECKQEKKKHNKTTCNRRRRKRLKKKRIETSFFLR
jgi:hypothetical protein